MKKNNNLLLQLKCFVIFILIILPVLLSTTLLEEKPVIFFTFNILTGLLGWTYVEYHIHRFWTHNKNANSSKQIYLQHMHHHQHPTEIKVTGLQRVLFLLLSALLFIISAWWNSYFSILTGMVAGFAWSCISHWILHRSWSRKVFPRLHRFHIHHHCKYPDRCFGFSTVLWDVIFNTMPPKNAVIPDRIIDFYYGHH